MAKGYKDIEDIILHRIKQGELQPGHRVGPLRSLAREQGVSLVTADRALRELSRKGILEHIKQQGFLVARQPLHLKGRIHVVLTTLDSRTPFSDLLDGILGEAWPRGYQVSVSCSQWDVDTCLQAVRRAVLENVDGVIYMPGGRGQDFERNRQVLESLRTSQVAVVTVGHCRLPSFKSPPGISSAHEQAGYEMTRHLLGKRNRRIAMVGTQPNQDEQAIVTGFERALREAEIPIRPHWLRFHTARESVIPDVQYLLHARERPDAVFALSDLVAAETMLEITRQGLSIPRDIRVVGFGDYPVGKLIRPALTTMRVNLSAVGSIAADALIRLMEGLPCDPGHVEIPCQLIERESCGTPEG